MKKILVTSFAIFAIVFLLVLLIVSGYDCKKINPEFAGASVAFVALCAAMWEYKSHKRSEEAQILSIAIILVTHQ